MKVLVVGSGGREHTLVWKIKQSARVSKLYCAPGNAGTSELAENVNIAAENIDELCQFARNNNIDLTVIGPEVPLAEGIADLFIENGLQVFGPLKAGAILEGSKAFAKKFMAKYNIPTAIFEVFDNRHQARESIAGRDRFPVVVKADGLAAGKGVLICKNRNEANEAIDAIMMDRQFGEAGDEIVIEDFLPGIEMSILAFVDKNTVVPMISAKDYKKIGEGDTGLNTGGMGAISPNPLYDTNLARECQEKVFSPTLKGLQQEGIDFRGILYFGLMVTDKGVSVLEYNVRFGDPETQVVLPRMKTDLVDIMLAVIEDRLNEVKIEWTKDAAATVVMASSGYPGVYEKGKELSGLEQIGDSIVFHAGTRLSDGKIVTSGGRVLAVTALAESVEAALQKSYDELGKINFDGAYFRRDIGI